LYEGGIRVPLLVRFPQSIRPGGVCHEPVACTDLARTLAEAAGATADSALDGLSLWPLLRDPQATLGRECLFFHYPHYYATTTPVSAVRAGDWKLLEFFEDHRLELYHLKDDPGERSDLAAREPARAQALHAKLQAWRTEVGAQLPVPNPNYRP
jgi:arylsulfatase A-like enzyme